MRWRYTAAAIAHVSRIARNLPRAIGPILVALLLVDLARPAAPIEAVPVQPSAIRRAIDDHPPEAVDRLRVLAYGSSDGDQFWGLRKWQRPPRIGFSQPVAESVSRLLRAICDELRPTLGPMTPIAVDSGATITITIENQRDSHYFTWWQADGTLERGQIRLGGAIGDAERARHLRGLVLRTMGLLQAEEDPAATSILAASPTYTDSDLHALALLYDPRLPVGLTVRELDEALTQKP